MIIVVFNIGLLISPIYAGLIFDHTDSYALVLLSFLPIYLAAGVFFLITRKPNAPVPEREAVYGR